MRFLTRASNIEQEFKRLISRCSKLRWAVAWASGQSDFALFRLLKKNEDKINQLTVGLHFYQTHPDFIDAFLDSPSVHFVNELGGTFHPKLYLFEHSNGGWDCITGSANFTKAAFGSNTEAVVHFSSEDVGAVATYAQLDTALNRFFASGKTANAGWLSAYRAIWQRQQRRLALLSGTYEHLAKQQKPKKSPLDVPLFVADWPTYFADINDNAKHSIKGRLRVLEEAQRLFRKEMHFCDMDDDDRRGIAGIFQTRNLRWRHFGNMGVHRFFPKAINDNVKLISDALDEIPITGDLTQTHYDRYAALIRHAYQEAGVGTATRLLAFKRPDYFVCLDTANRDGLCKEFEITRSVDLDNYWEKVIQRITESNWWNAPEPAGGLERRIWRCRAAFLDVKFYDPG